VVKQRDIEQGMDELGSRLRRHADDAGEMAHEWIDRGRHAAGKLGRKAPEYRRRLTRFAEDMSDEASWQYRRARRHVSRHPVATAAIVAGTVGAFLLLRRMFRSNEE